MLEKIYDKYDFDQDYEVYKYGQQVLIFNSIVNIFMFILGLCLHEGLMTLVWMLAFSGLRVNLGGYHCDSPVKCFVSSNLIFFLSMLSYKYLSSYFLLLFIPLGILFMLFFKYIPFINKKAKICDVFMITSIFIFIISEKQLGLYHTLNFVLLALMMLSIYYHSIFNGNNYAYAFQKGA